MELTKEECANASIVLQETKKALLEKDILKLKQLSNQTLHSSCSYQNPGSITTAVLIYALSKIIERGDYAKVKSWDDFAKKFNETLDSAIESLNKNDHSSYERQMQKARVLFESISGLKRYIQEVFRKAAINKASKIYEHGISLEQTSQLLGITQWELSEYIGHRIEDTPLNITIDVKKRAKMALEFFS